MRLAIISDIHGNLIALEAVLAEIAQQKIEHIMCLGDVAASGPQPRQSVERLQALGCPVVMGNTDNNLLNPHPKEQTSLERQRIQDINLWGSQQLTGENKAYLRTFQPTITYPLSDGKVLLAYHGSPRNYSELLNPTTPDDVLDQAFADVKAHILVGGHTHNQMFRRYKDQLVLNPGSVGLAMDRVSPLSEARNTPWAEYAVITTNGNALNVELRRTPFDISAFIQAILSSSMPHAEWLANEWNLV